MRRLIYGIFRPVRRLTNEKSRQHLREQQSNRMHPQHAYGYYCLTVYVSVFCSSVFLLYFLLYCSRRRGIRGGGNMYSGMPSGRPLSIRPLAHISLTHISLWKDFNETWHKYSSYKGPLLLRFTRSEVRGQGRDL